MAGRHFRSLYLGTSWDGKPGVGWSLLDQHPDGAGVCTACHAPTIAVGDPARYDLSKVRGVDAHGVHCDYCHKVSGDGGGRIGYTHGRYKLELKRPSEGQLFFEKTGRIADLKLTQAAPTPIPPGTNQVFGVISPTRLWQSVNATADFAWSGRAMAEHSTGPTRRSDPARRMPCRIPAPVVQVQAPANQSGVANRWSESVRPGRRTECPLEEISTSNDTSSTLI